MKKFLITVGIASILAPAVFISTPGQAQEAAPGPELEKVEEIIENAPEPAKTVLKEVLIPGPTQTVFRDVPGPVRTVVVTSPVPGPVRTVTVPGPTRTVVVTSPVPVVSIQPSPVRQTAPPSVIVSPVPQPTPSPTVIQGRERVVRIGVPEAIGISIGLVALGIALALLGIFIAYGLGWKDSERTEVSRLKNLSDELFGRNK